MGRAQVQQQAFEDLLALPEDAPFRAELLALAVRWRNIKQEHRFPMTHVEKELWKNSEQLYEQFCLKLKIEGKSEGLREGRAEGLRTAIRDLCEAFGIPFTEKHEQMLAALDAAQLEVLRLQIKRDRCW
jgi:flagellar biosynthesis/type III secretory pathway protein FliH